MIALITCHLAALAGSYGFFVAHIDLHKYPLYFLVPLVLAVYIPLSVTFLLPVDYISHHSSPIGGLSLSDSSTLFTWKATYWSTFVLTWFLLPILQDFYRTGHYSRISRLKASMRLNLRFQLIVLGVSLAAAVYLMLEVGLSFTNMKLMIIVLSHIYALVLALWLMAHGLVTVARHRWQEGNLVLNSNHYYLKVSSLVDALEDTKLNLKNEILTVLSLKKSFSNALYAGRLVFYDWIVDLHLQIPEDLLEQVRRTYVHDFTRNINAEQVTERYLASLTAKFQRHLYNYRAYCSDYDILLERIDTLQTLSDAKATTDAAERARMMVTVSRLPPQIAYIVHCYAKPVGARIVAVALYSVCFVILQSEFFHSTKVSLIDTLVFHSGIQKNLYIQVMFTFAVFLYMLFCSLNSLTRLKIFNMYHLVPHQSDPVSACFYASYIARMTVPLSYNFITLFDSRDSVFEEWYGKSIHFTGLFNMMNNWIPRLLLIPVVLTTFNVYERVKTRLGLHSDLYGWADFDDEEVADLNADRSQNPRKDLMIVKGKRIATTELARRKNDMLMQTQLVGRSSAPSAPLSPPPTSMENRLESYHDDSDASSTKLSIWGRLSG